MANPVSALTFTTQGALRKSALRMANDRLVLNCIRENPKLSRIDISRATKLSPSSVTFIVKRLTKERLVVEERVAAGAVQAGRPPTLLELTPLARFVVGVSIGRWRTQTVLADWTGTVVEKRDLEWNAAPTQMLRQVRESIGDLLSRQPEKRILGIGVSVAGTWDTNASTVTNAVNLGWHDVAVAPALSQGFHHPFYFDNNANLAALGERWFRIGGKQPLNDFVFVTLGSGIGTGIIVGGQVVQGAHGRAGEFGHMTLFPDGRKCFCGNFGCWEEYASDRALIRMVAEKTGVTCDVPMIAALAEQGDSSVVQAVREAASYLGLGVANLITGLNPEAIVVDDWASAMWPIVEPEVWKVVRARVPEAWWRGVRIERCQHAEDASLFGAVALALTRHFHSFDHGETVEGRNVVQFQ
ncbi:MAG: ROK family transcriptional regulator [Candidatus Solibacter usitatus]|nr:ROK family transcriptional regulator [Candidatus Solibacter usitatus]